MAITLSAKSASDVLRYTWRPAILSDDTLTGYGVVVSSGSVVVESSAIQDNAVVVFISGGTAGETAVFTASALTSRGEELHETIYLPIRSSLNTLGNTGRDIVAFALRKVTGGDMDAEQLEDGLERLSDMLASWSRQGADIGVAWPVEANTAIVADDATISAVKNNLILRLVDRYEFTPSPFVVEEARRGLQLVKASLLPDERGAEVYY